jgi:integrase
MTSARPERPLRTCLPLIVSCAHDFPVTTSAPVSDVKKAWEKAKTRAQIENFRFHQLRHTFASHFAMKGGNIYALAVILGHSNPAMTIERYAKLSPKYVRDQAATMDKKPYDGHRMDTKRVASEKRESLSD